MKWKTHESPQPKGPALTDEQIAKAITLICLEFGASVPTAFKVGGLFVEQLEVDREKGGT